MLRALRPFSLDRHNLEPGDEVTEAMLKLLPTRRFDVLVDQRYIEVVPDSETIAHLQDEIEKLKKRQGKPKARKPKAKQKVAA